MAASTLAPLLLLLALVLGSPVWADKNVKAASAPGAVQKVLGLIDEMAAKSKTRIASSVEDYKHFAVFCDKTVNEKVHALKVSADAEASIEAVIEESEATIGEHQATVVDLSQKIAAVNGELYKLQQLRDKEHGDFLSEEKELVGNVDTLEDFSKASALAQLSPGELQQINAVKAGVAKVIEASFVTHAQREKVTSFLDAQDDGLSASPQKEPSQAETFGRVMDMAETTLRDVRRNEATQQHEFMMSKQHLDGEVKAMNEQANAAKQQTMSTQQALAQARKDLAIEKKGQKEDHAFLQDVKMDCSSKTQDFEVDYRESTAELKALGEAKAILTNKFSSSLLETRVALHSAAHSVERSSDDAKEKALRLIQQLGKRLNSAALVSLSYQAATDPFGKVRQMVEAMVAKLQAEAAEEATQEVFCKEELGKTTKSIDKKTSTLETTDARIEKAGSAIAHLSEDVAALSQEVTAIDASIAEATGLRTSEKATFTTSERDLAESVEACNMAFRVLQKNADGTSLIQKGSDRGLSASATHAKGLDGIMEVLRVAESDYAEQLSKARASENLAEREYRRLMQESAQVKAVKLTEIKMKESEVKSLRTAVADYDNDRESMSAELGAVTDYLSQLKPRCEQEAPASYAQREAKRDAELEGLNEALSVLAQA